MFNLRGMHMIHKSRGLTGDYDGYLGVQRKAGSDQFGVNGGAQQIQG